MSLIVCPECGAKISSSATTCPHCGYTGDVPGLAICKQESYEVVPTFQYTIEAWAPDETALAMPRYEDNKALVEYFGDWERLQVEIPSLANAIWEMAQSEHALVAKVTPDVRKLIADGSLSFQLDKNGEIMPILMDGKTKRWAKQLRLENMELTPNVKQSLNHMCDTAMIAQILKEIESVGEAIGRIHAELQDDRMALAESAWDRLAQARMIQDARLRESAIMGALQGATEAKRVLMRGFARSRKFIEENSGKSQLQMMKDIGKRAVLNEMASDAFQDLVAITNAVRVECEGYTMLGEYEAGRESLGEFQRFILDNKLNERDTLLRLNGALKRKNVQAVCEFGAIADQIEAYLARGCIEDRRQGLLDAPEEEAAAEKNDTSKASDEDLAGLESGDEK